MTNSVFEGCSDSCGWIAALVATLSFGSYGMTIKESSKKNVDADPLVLQSYKVIVFFLSSFLVVFLGEELRWTSWGLVSSTLWNFGSTCGIYGVMYAGMATAEGTWSSVIVAVNFFFGILVFHEGVKSFAETCGSFVLLSIGLVGMSLYSTPSSSSSPKPEEIESVNRLRRPTHSNDSRAKLNPDDHEDFESGSESKSMLRQRQSTMSDNEMEEGNYDDAGDKGPKDTLILFGSIILSKRDLGIVASAVNGLCGGTSLVPMHYAAQEGFAGARYYFSFAAGSMIVLTAVWVALFSYRLFEKRGSMTGAFNALPSWHFKELWFPGIMSGILFSIGEFASILAITYLGQGVGNTFIQCKILIAGLWGLLYYKEITGVATVSKWFFSAALALIGILLLSHEHEHLPHH